MESARILIVDDDKETARLLGDLLKRHDYSLDLAYDVAAARQQLAEESYDLIVLDVRMPGEDGLDLCRETRARSSIPILMLTAMAQMTDRVVGLELGADDYVTKPFEGRELLARIRALLRRARGQGAMSRTSPRSSPLSFGAWRLDVAKTELRYDDRLLVPLTKVEFQILRAMAERPNVIMTRNWLGEAAQGSVPAAHSRNVDIAISRLRAKMAPYERGRPLIETVRSGGYVIRSTKPGA